ncbi:MAG: NAD-dependent epimerase/dehydratase family protein [Candidatus Omnitrophota bacterium]
MRRQRILITGGCGFVGSTLAINFHKQGGVEVIVFDNLYRKGSELNLKRIRKEGIRFVKGDVRKPKDLEKIGPTDVLIECSAEPSVLAGYTNQRGYLIDTNLNGCINCLEYAQKFNTKFVFISTSRVYPIAAISTLPYQENTSRFILNYDQCPPWCTEKGFTEEMPLHGYRSLYGASKLAAELMIQEYVAANQVHAVINRCGVLTGPWQMGKEDQGFVALWVARHFWQKPLKYIGFKGCGKQVRDILHVGDLFRLVQTQLLNFEKVNGQIFNIGGGIDCSISLNELTEICAQVTGNHLSIERINDERPGDIPIYLSDCSKAEKMLNWRPEKKLSDIILDIYSWIKSNEKMLKPILNS